MLKNRFQRLFSTFVFAAMLLPLLALRSYAETSACSYAPSLEKDQRTAFSDKFTELVRKNDASLPTQKYPANWAEIGRAHV